MKSACSGAFGVLVWVRITSRVGTTGAASSRVNTTPRMTTANRIADSTRVADSRCGGPIFGPGPGALTGGAVISAALGNPGLDDIEQPAGDVQPELLVQLAHAGR